RHSRASDTTNGAHRLAVWDFSMAAPDAEPSRCHPRERTKAPRFSIKGSDATTAPRNEGAGRAAAMARKRARRRSPPHCSGWLFTGGGVVDLVRGLPCWREMCQAQGLSLPPIRPAARQEKSPVLSNAPGALVASRA